MRSRSRCAKVLRLGENLPGVRASDGEFRLGATDVGAGFVACALRLLDLVILLHLSASDRGQQILLEEHDDDDRETECWR